jgi:hypothetical protein
MPQASSQSDPRATRVWLWRSLVGRRYQVVAAELALFLLFLIRSGGRSLTLFLLGFPLAKSDGLLSVDMVSG